ncbi:RNA polymerase sigma factor [Nibricoccus aquaticus]|uniref:RNA polymerase sigma factor n=1 Tax=Nibricoccus aquaticus TaxID=2576891 RepID=UPI0010FE4908|nr:sigma-70 family RNA polymerase sigma factor [Nibricoccus aquaticus]
MKTLPTSSAAARPNQETVLVAASLGGDRASFGQLVSLHQAAVSGVAYSICGDFAASEDLAQEAFVAAWKQLPDLQDPARFRAWVCGIARLLALNYVRTRARHALDDVTDPESQNLSLDEPSPRDAATTEEEKALLWRTLARLPENYREPLVLFYREQKSIAQVAAALELTDDVVKQRLSRGRVLLRDELSSVLETALFRTRPGSAFTAAVLTALPPALAAAGIAASAGTAKAASLAGAGSSKSSATAASTAGISLLGTVASAIIGLLGIYVAFRVWRGARIDPVVRTLLLRVFAASTAAAGLFGGAFTWVALTKNAGLASTGLSTGTTLTGLTLGYLALQSVIAVFLFARLQKLARASEAAKLPQLIILPTTRSPRRYESRIRFLDLPLIAIAQGADPVRGERIGIARGWLAFGDVAFGGLVGIGAVTLAPISIGAVSAGLVCISGIGLGALSFSSAAFGVLAFGGLAFGWSLAVGGLAFAHDIALGGIAISRELALGGLAYAPDANTAHAWQTFQSHPLCHAILHWLPHASLLSLLAVPSLYFAVRRLK